MKWYFKPENRGNTEILKPSDKYSISSNGSALLIKYMDLELRGKYSCRVTLVSDENENQNYDVNLNIYDLSEYVHIRLEVFNYKVYKRYRSIVIAIVLYGSVVWRLM